MLRFELGSLEDKRSKRQNPEVVASLLLENNSLCIVLENLSVLGSASVVLKIYNDGRYVRPTSVSDSLGLELNTEGQIRSGE